MADSNATYNFTVNEDLPDYPAGVVTYENLQYFTSGNNEVLAGQTYESTLDANGVGTQVLPAPDNTGTLAVNFVIGLPSGESVRAALSYSAGAQELSDILANASTTTDPDTITAALANKQNRDTDAVANNLARMNASGDAEDSSIPAAWNATDMTMDITHNANVTGQVNQEFFVLARNNSGSNITNGQVVKLTGSVSSRPTISLAQADAVANARQIGVATEDIDNNSTGFVTVAGLVRGLNTSAYNEGDVLYLSTSVAGAFTATKPTWPSIAIEVGIVVVKNATLGSIFVGAYETGAGAHEKAAAAQAAAEATAAAALTTHGADLTTHGFIGVQSAPFTTSELTSSGMWGLCSSGNQLQANIGGTVRAFPAVSPYPSKVLQYSPIAYYRLDELAGTVAIDSSGNGYHATYIGTNTPASIIAPFENYAPLFSTAGTDGGVELPSTFDNSFNGAEGAIVLIVKVLNVGIWTDTTFHFCVRLYVDGSNDIYIDKESTDNRLRFRRTAGGVNSIVNLDGISETGYIVLGIDWSESGDFFKAFYQGVQTGSTLSSVGTWAGGAFARRYIGLANASTTGWDGYIAESSFFSAPLGAAGHAALATDVLG